MYKFSIVGCGLLALLPVAHAEIGAKESTPLRLDCSQFQPLPRGYWSSGPNATLNGNVFGIIFCGGAFNCQAAVAYRF